MSQVVVYGASDDLIEVEGAISEEFYAPQAGEDTGGYLAFSDGTLLSISYTGDGLWKISTFSAGEGTSFAIESATDIDDNYSDRVTLKGDFKWVVMGTDLAKATK
jgi:hypothetical protein